MRRSSQTGRPVPAAAWGGGLRDGVANHDIGRARTSRSTARNREEAAICAGARQVQGSLLDDVRFVRAVQRGLVLPSTSRRQRREHATHVTLSSISAPSAAAPDFRSVSVPCNASIFRAARHPYIGGRVFVIRHINAWSSGGPADHRQRRGDGVNLRSTPSGPCRGGTRREIGTRH